MSRANLVVAVICITSLVGCSQEKASPHASSREAAPASYNPIPSTQPTIAAVPATSPASNELAAEFDAALVRLLNNEPPASASSALPADERQLIATVIDSLARFRQSLRDNSNATMAARVAPLLDLSDRVHAQSSLNVPTLAICKSVTQFGAFDEFEKASFPAGKETPTIVYCEIENFQSRQADPGRWETKLSYEAALYNSQSVDRSAPLWSKKPTTVVDECRNRRRDFFLADRFAVPANLPVGQYVLKVTVIDELANHVAEKSVPIIIAGD
jgi:hypothetical protein